MSKITLLLTAALMAVLPSMGQTKEEDKAITGGLLGIAQHTKFRVSDNSNLEYKFKFSWAAGGWASIPINEQWLVEPQLIYSAYKYQTNAATALMKNTRVGYLTLPVLMKLRAGKLFAFTFGPQVDFTLSAKDDRNNWEKKDLKTTSFAMNLGFEVLPKARVTPFLRYVHGFDNMDNTDNPNNAGSYHNQSFQGGLKFRIFGKFTPPDADGDSVIDAKDKCPNIPGLARYDGCPIPDTDGDGINDEADKCPSVAGLAKYSGCPIPDTDNDGINDEEDKCPTTAGLTKYNGCPIPDTDKDGINDEEDKCPTVAGLAKYGGCPIPDTDGDGINDENDRCPETAGVPEMQGCPQIISFDAHEVKFASGKSMLTADGKKELDLVVAYLQTVPENVTVRLIGHTDNSGSDKINDPLSMARAEAAKAYLVSQGISESRVSTEGKGSREPIADNSTAEGKAKNRRVEVLVK